MEVQERLSQALSDAYRIEGEVGSGGMATVFRAQALKHDRQVAIKVLLRAPWEPRRGPPMAQLRATPFSVALGSVAARVR